MAGGQRAYRFWEVGSWEPGPILPRDRLEEWIGPLAFTPDGRMLAISRSLQRVQLVDLTTLREVATLSAADAQPIQWLCFSPDGSRLAAAADNHTSQLWDLRAIRRQLAEIGLDWDLRAYAPLAQATEIKPLTVTVDLGDLGKLVPKDESR